MYNVAVVCRKKAFEQTRRKLGWWSYPVPDLEWSFYPVEDGQVVNKNKLANLGHDLIVWEDWCWNDWVGDAPLPIYAVIVDSNTSPRRGKVYHERAKQADVLLVDQDKLSRFNSTKKLTFRWQYAVNEFVFAPRQKTVDVGYHVAKTPARGALGQSLRAYCLDAGHSLTMGGGLTIDQLANRYGAARVVVHKSTFPQCRSHRFFDALASGACLITDRVWTVSEDRFLPGTHFVEWSSEDDLQAQITALLETGMWARYAEAGYNHVLGFHTWATRARELVSIIEGIHEPINA